LKIFPPGRVREDQVELAEAADEIGPVA